MVLLWKLLKMWSCATVTRVSGSAFYFFFCLLTFLMLLL